MPGYGWMVFPGRMMLLYVWQPLFSEEIDLAPKVALMLIGQGLVVSALSFLAFQARDCLRGK